MRKLQALEDLRAAMQNKNKDVDRTLLNVGPSERAAKYRKLWAELGKLSE